MVIIMGTDIVLVLVVVMLVGMDMEDMVLDLVEDEVIVEVMEQEDIVEDIDMVEDDIIDNNIISYFIHQFYFLSQHFCFHYQTQT